MNTWTARLVPTALPLSHCRRANCCGFLSIFSGMSFGEWSRWKKSRHMPILRIWDMMYAMMRSFWVTVEQGSFANIELFAWWWWWWCDCCATAPLALSWAVEGSVACEGKISESCTSINTTYGTGWDITTSEHQWQHSVEEIHIFVSHERLRSSWSPNLVIQLVSWA